MAPFKFPINDWDGNGSTDDLYDIYMEKKVCESFETKKEDNILDRSIVDSSFSTEQSSGDSNVWGIVFVISVIMVILGFIMNLD